MFRHRGDAHADVRQPGHRRLPSRPQRLPRRPGPLVHWRQIGNVLDRPGQLELGDDVPASDPLTGKALEGPFPGVVRDRRAAPRGAASVPRRRLVVPDARRGRYGRPIQCTGAPPAPRDDFDAVNLHAAGDSLDRPGYPFVGRRQQHPDCRFEARPDPGTGRAGLSVRLDEAHHCDLEVGGGEARVIARIRPARQCLARQPVPAIGWRHIHRVQGVATVWQLSLGCGSNEAF